ncbi:6753_t:CDS:10 [Paraglomus occultum]|uniref:6753_t:CDS:1 n=1 Tax=Paraglomus occultum TaxID=144539 RepID=A0A9N9CTE7_9GLOM|nr:6753_t:CDS:10 [Paraglomus occultum]
MPPPDFRVVVGIDFGTYFSAFAFTYRNSSYGIESQGDWPSKSVREPDIRTPTVLEYDNQLNVISWGHYAERRPIGRQIRNAQYQGFIVRLFKSYLGNMAQDEKPRLPKGLDYKRVITDYLKELNKVIKKALQHIQHRWSCLDRSQIFKIMTIPAEYDEKARYIMRECAFKAGIIDTLHSESLQFITEPEATAIYCFRSSEKHNLTPGSTFLVVDYGVDTVDLVTWTVLPNNKLSITERTNDFCGSTYIDREFMKYIASIVGKLAMRTFEENHVTFWLIQSFRDDAEYMLKHNDGYTKSIDICELCSPLKKYVQGDERKRMEAADWEIELDYETVKSIFDPVVERVLYLMRIQLEKSRATSTIFLVGELSKYLLRRIKSEFSSKVSDIAVPVGPLVAVSRGAVYYGVCKKKLLRQDILNLDDTAGQSIVEPSLGVNATTIRTLKHTYGIEIRSEWKPGDPPQRRTADGHIYVFKALAQRGTIVSDDCEFKYELMPTSFPHQTVMKIELYITCDYTAKYCDEPGVKLFAQLSVELPDAKVKLDRTVTVSLIFRKKETRVQFRMAGKTYGETSLARDL